MIRIVENKNDIVSLWQEAFGDTKDEILFFCNNVKNAECIGFYENEMPVAFMYVVSCSLNGIRSNYIYAACTLKEYCSRGIMTELLNYTKSEYKKLCLIPADEKLVEYYKTRGFINVCSVDNLSFDETNEVREYLFEGCSLQEPIVLEYKGE